MMEMAERDDYYEPHACLALMRPVVLGGQVGCGARLIGRSLSARTGLPFVEVDRQVEHEAGVSLAKLAAEQGVGQVAARARSVLEAVAIRRPWSIVVLDRAWPTSEVRPLFRRRLDFVHVRRPAGYLRGRMRQELWRSAGGNGCAVLSVEGRSEEEVDACSTARDSLLNEAKVLVEAGEQHEHRVGEILLGALETITHAEAR